MIGSNVDWQFWNERAALPAGMTAMGLGGLATVVFTYGMSDAAKERLFQQARESTARGAQGRAYQAPQA